MGSGGPKLRLGEEELAAMAEAVYDAITTNSTSDPILAVLLELAITSIQDNRPIFPNPIDEPLMYRRYFLKWVTEGLEDAAKLQRAQEENEPQLSA